jgi:hypothetical protein
VVDEIGFGYARTEIPSLIRASAKTGCAFHLRNAKNPEAASALLVSPGALERLIVAPVRLNDATAMHKGHFDRGHRQVGHALPSRPRNHFKNRQGFDARLHTAPRGQPTRWNPEDRKRRTGACWL